MFKKIFIAVAVVFAAFLIFVALQPSEVRVERTATIAAPPAVVFAQVNDFHKWEAWSPWAKLDPAAKVTFEGGKATKAVLNWGQIEAPSLVKGAMWTATATDNTFNVLDGMVVDDINDFISKKCMEVKDEWQSQ